MKVSLLLMFVCVFISACQQSDEQDLNGKQVVVTTGATDNAVSAESSSLPTDLIPASMQRAGDAVAGKHALINQPIVSCGIPLSAMKQLDANPLYTFSEREGEAAQLAYNLNLVEDEQGVQIAASNCLTCHAAPLFGELVIGLGNEFLDFTTNASAVVEQSGALVSGESETQAWEKFANRIAAIAPYIQMQTAGVNPANNLTFALMAHRDPQNMQWHEEPLIKPPPQLAPPVSVPPWWRMKKKHAMFWMGEGRGDHASIMMTAAILCADSKQDVQKLDAIAPDIRTYIESIEPPVYPFEIDSTLAQQGKKVFEDTCSACHGTYGEQVSYPNRIVPIDVVGTDPSLIEFAFGDGQAYVEWFNQSLFAELAQVYPSKGYVAPPLDGIWATAPFLHNGSVPTIRALLNSPTRPSLWRHEVTDSASKTQFNQSDLGWNFIDLANNAEASAGVGAAWVYDTRVKGYSNTGHQFGDGLSAAQRDAVIEYLKTL